MGGGDVSKVKKWDDEAGEYRMFFANPCVAWQVVGGKCRIMREQMVREFSRFSGGTVHDAIMQGGGCREGVVGEQNCNYYSFARFRETFEPPTQAHTPGPTQPPTKLEFNTTTSSQPNSTDVRESQEDIATFAKMSLIDLLDGRSAEEYLALAAEGRTLSVNISAAV